MITCLDLQLTEIKYNTNSRIIIGTEMQYNTNSRIIFGTEVLYNTNRRISISMWFI